MRKTKKIERGRFPVCFAKGAISVYKWRSFLERASRTAIIKGRILNVVHKFLMCVKSKILRLRWAFKLLSICNSRHSA